MVADSVPTAGRRSQPEWGGKPTPNLDDEGCGHAGVEGYGIGQTLRRVRRRRLESDRYPE